MKDKNINQDQENQLHELNEQWKRSIPALVFLNYFFSLNYLVQQTEDALDLTKLSHFQEFNPELTEQDIYSVKQHLLNSWNTEYALRTTARMGDDVYLKNALHWTFPQAYYSVFEGLQAFLRLKGFESGNPNSIMQEAGFQVVRGAYPQVISFYATGHPHKPKIYRLPNNRYKASLHLADEELDAQAHVGQFLRTTHRQKGQQVRQRVQSNPAVALRSTKSGKVLERFTDEHWVQLTWRIGYTTIFSFLSRLRISANHREITRFVEADIDFRLFHQSLQNLVSYLNFVHEAYVVKAIGVNKYRELVKELPDYLKESFVMERFEQWILPMLQDHAPALKDTSLSLSA